MTLFSLGLSTSLLSAFARDSGSNDAVTVVVLLKTSISLLAFGIVKGLIDTFTGRSSLNLRSSLIGTVFYYLETTSSLANSIVKPMRDARAWPPRYSVITLVVVRQVVSVSGSSASKDDPPRTHSIPSDSGQGPALERVCGFHRPALLVSGEPSLAASDCLGYWLEWSNVDWIGFLQKSKMITIFEAVR